MFVRRIKRKEMEKFITPAAENETWISYRMKLNNYPNKCERFVGKRKCWVVENLFYFVL